MTSWKSIGEPVVAVRKTPSDRSFGLTVGGVLLAFAAFTAWRGHALRAGIVGGVGALLVLGGLARPAALKPLAAGWGRVGHALGWFNSRVLLTVMFALVFAPIGWMVRRFGTDPLDRRRSGDSRWVPYADRFRDPKHYEHPF